MIKNMPFKLFKNITEGYNLLYRFKARQHIDGLRQQELEFLGMTVNSDKAKPIFSS